MTEHAPFTASQPGVYFTRRFAAAADFRAARQHTHATCARAPAYTCNPCVAPVHPCNPCVAPVNPCNPRVAPVNPCNPCVAPVNPCQRERLQVPFSVGFVRRFWELSCLSCPGQLPHSKKREGDTMAAQWQGYPCNQTKTQSLLHRLLLHCFDPSDM